jgi:multicomponent Na+:H+ antiporter subunit G
MEMVINILSWILLSIGAVFCVIGGIGLLRLPDFYSRTHGASITDTGGAGLVLTGLILQSLIWDADLFPYRMILVAKLILILLFMLFTSPTSGHALAKAAFARGIEAEVVGDTV